MNTYIGKLSLVIGVAICSAYTKPQEADMDRYNSTIAQVTHSVHQGEEEMDYSQFELIEDMGELVFSSHEGKKSVALQLEANKLPLGTDKVMFTYDANQQTVTIVKGESEQVCSAMDVQVYVIDSDGQDNAKEIVVVGMGRGGNTVYTIIKEINKKLIKIGEIFSPTQMDSKGHLLNCYDVITFSKEPIIGAVYTLNSENLKKELIFKEEKSFTIEEDVTVNFSPENNTLEEGITTFEKGSEFVIKGFNVKTGRWQVQINGHRGEMHLQVAG